MRVNCKKVQHPSFGPITPKKRLSSTRDGKLVKSARRVLEVLEYFDDVKTQMTVMQVASGLGYPQSSTSALLKSLVSLGYLNYNARKRTYVSSSRVAMLGNWVGAPFSKEGAIVALMRSINASTGLTVVLGMRVGVQVMYVQVVSGSDHGVPRLFLGTLRPLVNSALGLAILSSGSDVEAKRIVIRHNAELESGATLVRHASLMQHLTGVRNAGYIVASNPLVGESIIASPLPRIIGQPRMSLGIHGPANALDARIDVLAQRLILSIDQTFGVSNRDCRLPRAVSKPAFIETIDSREIHVP